MSPNFIGAPQNSLSLEPPLAKLCLNVSWVQKLDVAVRLLSSPVLSYRTAKPLTWARCLSAKGPDVSTQDFVSDHKCWKPSIRLHSDARVGMAALKHILTLCQGVEEGVLDEQVCHAANEQRCCEPWKTVAQVDACMICESYRR